MPPCSPQTIEDGALISDMMFPSIQQWLDALYFGKICPNEPKHSSPDLGGKFLLTRAAQLRLVCQIQYTFSIDLLSAFYVQDSPNVEVAPDSMEVR